MVKKKNMTSNFSAKKFEDGFETLIKFRKKKKKKEKRKYLNERKYF